MSGEFARAIFVVGTVVVTGIVWYGYRKNIFSPWFAWLTTLVFVAYMCAFLLYRFAFGYMQEEIESNATYKIIGMIHGVISLAAIVYTCLVFIYAERTFSRGENYFTQHKKSTVILLALWPLALITGFFL